MANCRAWVLCKGQQLLLSSNQSLTGMNTSSVIQKLLTFKIPAIWIDILVFMSFRYQLRFGFDFLLNDTQEKQNMLVSQIQVGLPVYIWS